MNVVVINGTEKRGVTYRLKEMFLAELPEGTTITQFYLPRDCDGFCTGCMSCILKGCHACDEGPSVQVIDQALRSSDLMVFTSPAYVYHVTGAMKAFLDHFAFRWMPHRPAPEMFGKRAVIITQCLGRGAKTVAKDIRHSLSWWGVSSVHTFTGTLMNDVVWERLPKSRQDKLTAGVQKLGKRCAAIDYSKPAATRLPVRIKFAFCRAMQKSLHEADPEYVDGAWWADQGWLGAASELAEILRHERALASESPCLMVSLS